MGSPDEGIETSSDHLPIEAYKDDMDAWLGLGLTKLGTLKPDELEKLSAQFRQSLRNNLLVFKEHSFRKYWSFEPKKRSIINASVFDVMSCSLATVDQNLVRERSARLWAAMLDQYNQVPDARFSRAVSYSPHSPREVRMRFVVGAEVMNAVFYAD